MKLVTKKLEGRDHYVVPVVMIREGTWSGSRGPVHYPGEVLQNTMHLWDGKPIVVYHPSMHGTGYAGHPDVFNAQKVGTIFNTTFKDGKLKAEAWLDKARLDTVDPRVSKRLREQEPIEVSTGVAG